MAWFGDLDVVLHYLGTVGADRNEDGEFIISGENVVVGLDPKEVIIPDGTLYFVGGRPKGLAANLHSTTERGVQVKLLDNPPLQTHREAFAGYLQSAHQHLRHATTLHRQGRNQAATDAVRHAECDIRQAYTEAHYGKRDDEDLRRMTTDLEAVYPQVHNLLQELRETS